MKPSQDFIPIRGKLVVLHPRNPELLKEFYAKRFRPEVLRWADTWPKNPSFEEVGQRFEKQERSSNQWRLWIHTLDGKLIGQVSLFDIDKVKRQAEFGVVLFAPPYWGQGYGTEAARLFLTDACRRFDLELVYLSTAQDNKRAIRSFEKLGFRITERLSTEDQRSVIMQAPARTLFSAGD